MLPVLRCWQLQYGHTYNMLERVGQGGPMQLKCPFWSVGMHARSVGHRSRCICRNEIVCAILNHCPHLHFMLVQARRMQARGRAGSTGLKAFACALQKTPSGTPWSARLPARRSRAGWSQQ